LATFWLAVSTLTAVIALIGSASTIILGWRADRRQSAEFRLKIEQLELQLAEARQKTVRN
jgi:L-asparagine transporter-like permease